MQGWLFTTENQNLSQKEEVMDITSSFCYKKGRNGYYILLLWQKKDVMDITSPQKEDVMDITSSKKGT